MDTTINLLLPTDTAIQLSKIGLASAYLAVTEHPKAATEEHLKTGHSG
jgi:hypothetical protein